MQKHTWCSWVSGWEDWPGGTSNQPWACALARPASSTPRCWKLTPLGLLSCLPSPLWGLEKSVLQPVIPFSPNFIFSTPNCGEFRGETLKRKYCTHKTVNMKTLMKEMTFQIVQVVWFYGKLWQLSFGPGISEERRVSVLMQSWLVSPEWTSEENAWNQVSCCFWWSQVILALRQDWEHRGRCSKFPWLQVNPGDSETPTKQDYVACCHQEETVFVLPKWASFPLPRISCLCYRGT